MTRARWHYLAFHVLLSATQWLGVALLAGTTTVVAMHPCGRHPTGVEAPGLDAATWVLDKV